MADQRRGRPIEVTVIVVVTYLSAIIDLVFGVLLILARYLPDAETEGYRTFVTYAGAILILFGFFTVFLASGVARADRPSRSILTAMSAIGAGFAAVAMLVDPDDLWLFAGYGTLSIAIIIVLWTGRAHRYFAKPDPSSLSPAHEGTRRASTVDRGGDPITAARDDERYTASADLP